jgi:DNA-binding response OmpR family regulator
MRLLVIEDDSRLASLLARTLREEHYAVDVAEDGQEGEWLAFENPYDLIVMDLMLPRKSGLQILKSLRDNGSAVPVLILTAKDTKQDVVAGLDAGGDDYLTKPFSLEELLARVRALLRRPASKPIMTLSIGPLRVDTTRKEVWHGEIKLDLTAREFALTEYLARQAGQVVSRASLAEHVWDASIDPMSNVVDVYIGYLRNKIDKPFGTRLVKTVRGHGYMLDTSDEDAPC